MNIIKKLAVLLLTFIIYTIIPVGAENINTTDNVFDNNYQNIGIDKKYKNSAKGQSLSPVEKMFNVKENFVSGNMLQQVGYDQFNYASSSGTQVTGKYDSSYKLSIGERVNVYSYGGSVDVMTMSGSSLLTPMTKTEVSSNGFMFIQGLGLIKAEDRTLGEVEKDANFIASRKFKNVKIKLTVSSGGEFSVFVYGEVNKPGKVYVGNNSSVLDALGAAGGVKKTGTLRNIKYNRGKNIDLYRALFSGEDENIILKPNDKIFVGKIGEVIALKNGVTVPGIYEIKPGETIKDITEFAGGMLATTEYSEVVMIGFDGTSKQKTAKNVNWEEAVNTVLKSGDTIEFRELYNGAENIVTLQGNIKHPATYAYKEGMRLSDILKSENELLEETFISQAVIRRVSGSNNTVVTIPVFLTEFFSGMNDPILKPRDIITVYKNTNSKFVDVYGCINTPKHLTYTENMTLNDVMSDIKFIESGIKNENPQTSEDSEDDDNNSDTIKLTGATENYNKIIPVENVAVEITNSQGDTKVYYLYDIMINSDRIKSIAINPEDRIFFRTLRDNETLKTVKISGFVKDPGVYSFVSGQKLVDLIKMAGGLTEEADLKGLVYRRANLRSKQIDLAKTNNDRDIRLIEGRIAGGYKQTENDRQSKTDMIEQLKEEKQEIQSRYTGQIALNIKSNDINKISKLDNIEIQDGDDVYIPRISRHVSVLGEVYNEQAFVYKEGMKAKGYIKQVGGYTPNANKFRIYKVGVNGRAQKIRLSANIEPGDTIIVPRRIAGNDWLTPICETIRSLASLAIMAVAISKW